MRLRRPVGVRLQLAAAMVALAVISVAVAGLLIHRAADVEIRDFGRRDLQQTANRIAVTAAFAYDDSGGWTGRRVAELIEAERAEDHAVVLLDERGRPMPGSAPAIPPNSRRAPVLDGGRQVGTAIAGHAQGGFLQVGRGATKQRLDARLSQELDRRLVESALVAAGLAVLLALLLALRVAEPLQRLTAVARRMAHGEIDMRAAPARGNRETQELAQTLDRLAAELRRQDELRRATSADVAHEMRNAMVGVVGRIEALQDGVVPDVSGTLERTARDARRVYQLVDDVRLLAEAQRPGLLVEKRPVDLHAVAAERVAAFADRFREGSIALECRLAPARVEGDAERLAQIIDNLLSNALRYTDPGGHVTIALEARDGDAVLRVADTGIGIAPEHLGRIFDRFWRVPETRERAAAGSGVGLALVRDLVIAHDGRVDVESRLGKGSTFSVHLPLAGYVDASRDGTAPGDVQRVAAAFDAVKAD
jgi:two-component system sensor histidine kinase BaeS